MCNDIFEHNFLFVAEDDRRHSYADRDHIQYGIFLVLFCFENKYQLATNKNDVQENRSMKKNEEITK